MIIYIENFCGFSTVPKRSLLSGRPEYFVLKFVISSKLNARKNPNFACVNKTQSVFISINML